jgi:hypothetical protein
MISYKAYKTRKFQSKGAGVCKNVSFNKLNCSILLIVKLLLMGITSTSYYKTI